MKENVKKEEIQANIYDKINIIVDYKGLTDDEIMEKSSMIDTIMSENYTKCITPLTYEEIEEYALRQKIGLSMGAKRSCIEQDKAIRYTSMDNLVEVVIYRKFTNIVLDYNDDIEHVLSDYFNMMVSLVECLNEEKEFFKIQTVSIQKRNTIYCKSLEQVYRCFEKKSFGTFIQRDSDDLYNLNAIQNKESFFKDDLEFDVYKSIEFGLDNNRKKDIYMGQFNITGRYDTAPLDGNDVKNVFDKINNGIFDIFMGHITDGFLEDMKNGKTSKVVGGFHI